MREIKTKSIQSIESKMDKFGADPIRYEVLQYAKSFKTSWIGLGQALYTVWKDKLYKNWGYGNFDVYTSKEIGIRKQTALKLLKSYYFLEKEGPEYIAKGKSEDADAALIPTYEAVDILRLASRKKDMDKSDYISIKKDVLERGKDAREVKKELTALIRQRDELEPEEARRQKRIAVLKRLLSTLKSLKNEVKILHMLPDKIISDTDKLIRELELEIPR